MHIDSRNVIHFLKISGFIPLVTLLAIIPLFADSTGEAAYAIELTPTETHHTIELNSNQPYVAGYHVNTPDLYTMEEVLATSITISFPATNTIYFPSGSWLGGGMFVQAQDSKLRHIDYAFYTMLVIDASGTLFLDLGLHQTRESTAPLQMPTQELIYAYTWQISGIDLSTPVTLLASWDPEGFVHYSISASGTNITLPSINVASLPNCASIIRKFYAGNYITYQPFPFGHYVYYFQFGIVSSEIIVDTHWSVDLKDPKILRRPGSRLGSGWHFAETAWSTQGDISYLDSDWTWGGAPYYGVSAQYHENPLENPYETIFFYNGQTLSPGTILWQNSSSKSSIAATFPMMLSWQTLGRAWLCIFSIETMVVIEMMTKEIRSWKLRKKHMKIKLHSQW